jgi:CRISPR type III-A-associated RAMP protein Csm4
MTKNFQVFRLHFQGPVHFSRGREDFDDSLTVFKSDSLKSALFVSALRVFGPELANEAFFRGFRVSSAFPFFEDELFFPRPNCRIPKISGIPDDRQGKPLKRIQYFGQGAFERLIGGDVSPIEESQLMGGGLFVSDRRTNMGDRAVYQRNVRQRVTVPAPGEAADPVPFYFEQLYFGSGCGLWFMLEGESTTAHQVERVLVELGQSGIGTDRSVGHGQFEVEGPLPLSLRVPDRPSHQVALSMFCPEPEFVEGDCLPRSSYRIEKRGGWLANPANMGNTGLRKRSVYMFSEGSVFPIDRSAMGKVVDLRPETPPGAVDHPVWRDGRPILIPASLTL